MAELRPFQGLRFTPQAGPIEELVCPPYDIVSEEQRQEYLKVNPHNVIRLELPRDGEDPYETAGETLRGWLSQHVLAQDKKPCMYIYEEEFNAHGQRRRVKGLIALVKLEEFSKGVVLPHEETLSKAKTDRFHLMGATFCNFSQIYSLYNDDEGKTFRQIQQLSADTPAVEFTGEEDITHRLWRVESEDALRELSGGFVHRKLYIADGHHRYETALNFRNALREQGIAKKGDLSGYVMMLLVDMENEGLVVFPTHRLVRDLKDFQPEQVLQECGAYFDVEEHDDLSAMEAVLEQCYNEGKKSFGFFSGGSRWQLLTLKEGDVMAQMLPGASPALQGLDVSVLHSLILERIMGIDKENMAKQINLTYTKVFDEAIEGVRSGEFQCAFLLNPTKVSEIRDVAAAGEKMPQKSTYFYPKAITGLVMNMLKS